MEKNLRKYSDKSDDYKIYVVVSQTGSIVSRLLKLITGAEYNHVSISTDKSLENMYSFARKYKYNPVWGGFVKENPLTGTLGRFQETQAVVMSVPVSEEQFAELGSYLENMYKHKGEYHYNYAGLFMAWFNVCYHRRNCYFCSEFVKETLGRFGVIDEAQFEKIVKPVHFLDMAEGEREYSGNLKRYALLEHSHNGDYDKEEFANSTGA